MQLTDLGPIDGFALSGLHVRLSFIEGDAPARRALVAAARQTSPDGTVVLILGPDQAAEVAAAIDRSRTGAVGARLRAAGRSTEVERARAALGAAQREAARTRAAVERVLAQRSEVDEAVRSVRERIAAGETDDELEAQVAEVQRVLDQTEAERRARATDADLSASLAEAELRRAEDEMRELHERIAGPDPGDAERSLEERGERLRSRVLDAEQACDRAEEAHRAALAAQEDAIRQADAPDSGGAGPADVVRSLHALGSLDARGPIPVLFDEPFEFDDPGEIAAVIAALTELSLQTQVLYLTANPDLLAWATTLPGPSGALIVPGRPAPVRNPSTGREPIHT
jgi:hypothetical protein